MKHVVEKDIGLLEHRLDYTLRIKPSAWHTQKTTHVRYVMKLPYVYACFIDADGDDDDTVRRSHVLQYRHHHRRLENTRTRTANK